MNSTNFLRLILRLLAVSALIFPGNAIGAPCIWVDGGGTEREIAELLRFREGQNGGITAHGQLWALDHNGKTCPSLLTTSPKYSEKLSSRLLKGAHFSGVRLDGLNIRSVNLSKVVFDGGSLTDVTFENVNLKDARFLDTSLRQVNIDGGDAASTYFTSLEIEGLRVTGTNLRSTRWNGSMLRSATFKDLDLIGSSFREARLDRDVVMLRVQASETIFMGAELTGIRWTDVFLGAGVCELSTHASQFTPSNMRSAKLRSAIILRTDLSNVDLEDAILEDSYINKSCLASSHLLRTSLNGTRIEGSDLRGASFLETQLETSVLVDSNLSDALWQPASNPAADRVVLANGLSQLRWKSDPAPLAALQKSLSDNGFNIEARQVFAGRRRPSAGIIEKLLLDLTSEYASNIARPFAILFAIFVVCTSFYVVLLGKVRGATVTVDSLSGKAKHLRIRRIVVISRRPRRARVWLAIFASLQYTFRFGDIDQYLAILTRRNVYVRVSGRLRILAGVQSIASSYLLFLIAFALGRMLF